MRRVRERSAVQIKNGYTKGARVKVRREIVKVMCAYGGRAISKTPGGGVL